MGIDASEPSEAALDWAAEEAVLRQLTLRLVRAPNCPPAGRRTEPCWPSSAPGSPPCTRGSWSPQTSWTANRAKS
ncbi:hypothetical protein ACFQ0M_02635 [Kitasatospora aburaviensis]